MRTFQLTPRLEAEIIGFASVLSRTPDDLLMATFEAPPPKSSRPRVWIPQPEQPSDPDSETTIDFPPITP
jgi:hypothetical protein